MGSGQSKPTTTGVGGASSSVVPVEEVKTKEIRTDNNSSKNVAMRTISTTPKNSTEEEKKETESDNKNEGGGGGGCPMKRTDGSYSYNPAGWFKFGGGNKKHPHGPGGSMPLASRPADTTTKDTQMAADDGIAKEEASSSGGGGGCPVKGTTTQQQQMSDVGGGGGGCPVKGQQQTQTQRQQQQQQQYNVYSQPIDPTNQMPSVANQLPSPGQKVELSTERISSTIPKGGAPDDVTWTYPSTQMFYNALSRKNKLGTTTEHDMDTVVALHNNMNEKTWDKVCQWESILNPSTSDNESNENEQQQQQPPKLLKFIGRPSDLSPKARFKHYVFGHPLPFDRHDWTILRSDGTQVRYVIDYYHDDSRASTSPDSAMPNMHDRDAVQSLLVDVRPAVDGVRNVFDRVVYMPYARKVNGYIYEELPWKPTEEMKGQVGESLEVWKNIQKAARESKSAKPCGDEGKKIIVVPKDDDDENEEEEMQKKQQQQQLKMDITKEQARDLALNFASALKQCQDAQHTLNKCQTEEECTMASLALTICLSKILCPLQHSALTQSLNADNNIDLSNDAKAEEAYNMRVEKALENVTLCVSGINEQVSIARKVYPDEFQGVVVEGGAGGETEVGEKDS